MKIVGLCGQSGAGKTTALSTLLETGAAVCDCDRVSREVMSKGTECTAEVIGVFGEGICSCGEINRRALGEIVFNDAEKLAVLTEITHRYIKAEVYRRMDEARERGERLFVIDAPLLFESGLDSECDITLAIVADKEKRIKRIMMRDGIDRLLAEKRIASQLSEDELYRRADCVIVNDGTAEELAEAVRSFVRQEDL